MSDSRRVNEVRANCEPLNGDGLLHRLVRQNNYKELAKVSPGPGVNCQNNRMETPLIVAAQASAIRIISSLTALGADVDAQDAQGNTALHYAVLNSSERAIDSLSYVYVNFNILNSVGRTAMHFLSISNSPNLAKQLSRDVFRIDMEITDRDGNTPFMAAVRYDSSRMVQYFLQIRYRPDKK
jgi:ankyrin repeat protein